MPTVFRDLVYLINANNKRKLVMDLLPLKWKAVTGIPETKSDWMDNDGDCLYKATAFERG